MDQSSAVSRDNSEKNSSEGNILTQQYKVSFAHALLIEKNPTTCTIAESNFLL